MRHIAIIDDGINEKYFKQEIVLKNNIEITNELKFVERYSYNKYAFSHGTICAGIIAKYGGSDIEISSIKILNSNYTGLCEQLIEAINWCVENGVNLVNISLGSKKWDDFLKLKSTICKAVGRNVILIAANNNKGLVTYPASMSSVLGVKAFVSSSIDSNEFSFNPYNFNGIEIECNGNHLLELHNGCVTNTGPSNSFATAYATSVISKIVNDFNLNSFYELKSFLYYKFHRKDYLRCYTYRNLDWIENAFIFNFNKKEMKGVELLPLFNQNHVNVNTIYDFNDLCLYTLQYLQMNINILTEFDAVIIISECKNSNSPGSSFTNLCNFLNEYKLKLYILDEYINIENYVFVTANSSNVLCCHDYCYNFIDTASRSFNGPVISIYDFSGEQLLDTLGNLFKLFRLNGYDVSGVTNNKLAVLLGMEYIQIEEELVDNINYINYIGLIHNSDIMINGLTIKSNSFDNIKKYNSYLKEDILIFIYDCFDNDKVQQIKRYLCNSKILIICKNSRYAYCSDFVYDLNKVGYEMIFNQIINYFNKE